jgi:hypothetical protein
MAKYKGTAVQSQKQEFTQTIEIDTIDGDLTVTGNVINSVAPAHATHLTNKSYVDTQVSNLVDSAPELLNTLNEISAAIGDDATFATSIQTQLNAKAPLASPTFTGTVTVPTPSNNTDATTKAYVDTGLALGAPLSNPTFTGNVTVPTPTADTDAATKNYVDITSTAKAAALSIALG